VRQALLVLLAVVLQATVLERLPLPGAAPDLLLVLVVVLGLLEGPRSAMLAGFAGGLLVDLSGDAELGRTALVLVVVGFLAGQLQDDVSGSPVVPALLAGGLAAVAVVLAFAGGLLLSDPRATGGAFLRSLLSLVAYSAVLAPVVLPAVAALLRRTDRRT